MPTEAPPSDQSYRQLAAYLRRRPEASRFPPERVAEESGLPVELVRAVMSAPLSRPDARQSATLGLTNNLKKAGATVTDRMEQSMRQPVLFVLIVSIVGVLVMLAGWRLLPEGEGGRSFRLAFAGSAAVGVVLLHYLCYFHTGRVRVALIGAGIVWTLSVVAFAVPLLRTEQATFEAAGGMLRALVALSLGLLMLTLLYLGIAVILSVLGGYAKLRKEERSRDKLSRQELLEQLFQLEEQIRSSVPNPDSEKQPWWRSSLPLGINPYLASFGLGAIATAAQTAFFVAAGVGDVSDGPATSPPMFMLFGAILSFVGLAAMALVAFLARGLRRALVCAVVYLAAQLLVSLVPIGPFGPAMVMGRGTIEWGLFLAIPLSLAFAAGLGGKIEDRAAQQRRLQANDAASLLAEMLDIQRRLNPAANTVHVLYVDVAGSSELKADQDPLRVEYTFREYHRLIERTCSQFNGKVHGSAGDDAVAEFACARDAYDAARRLQSKMGCFNSDSNRLGKPLRIRIGLHTGVVPGELENIQFTRVIDIAAHVQEVAPIGGIAMTRPVAEQLADERLAELREMVDGEAVHIALDPLEVE